MGEQASSNPSVDQDGRGPDGKWLPGYQPPGAAPTFPPGVTGNPAGRPSFGATTVEWINQLRETPEPDLERIARDRGEKPTKRAAAIQLLEILAGATELADFADLANDDESLQDVKRRGLTTRRIRKLKTTVRRIDGKDGETETRREIELSDKGGDCLDRLLDRTIGKPSQSVAIDLRDSRSAEQIAADVMRMVGAGTTTEGEG